MTKPSPNTLSEGLVKRLRERAFTGGLAPGPLFNRDGPEAAATIERLTAEIKVRDEESGRAVLLMRLAAKMIASGDLSQLLHYDGADCDSYCLADDLQTSADLFAALASRRS